MIDFFKAVLGAQPYALFIIAGLAFIGIAVVGSIKTYINPGDKGRIASGIIGAILLIAGFSMYRQQSVPPIIHPPAPASTPSPTPTSTPAPKPKPEPSVPSVAGTWRGVVWFPPQDPLHFVLHISGQKNELLAVADSPDQNRYSLAVNLIVLHGHRVHFAMTSLDVDFQGVLSGNQISGIFVQRGIGSNLVLARD